MKYKDKEESMKIETIIWEYPSDLTNMVYDPLPSLKGLPEHISMPLPMFKSFSRHPHVAHHIKTYDSLQFIKGLPTIEEDLEEVQESDSVVIYIFGKRFKIFNEDPTTIAVSSKPKSTCRRQRAISEEHQRSTQ